MAVFEGATPEAIATQLIIAAKYGTVNPEQMTANLKSGKPNADNLVVTNLILVGESSERLFAGDGMPLEGNHPDSYQFAPEPYARAFEPYPREDSESRVQASETGARINAGAVRHLHAFYPRTLGMVGGLAIGKQAELEAAGESPRALTTDEALDVLNGCVAMWSLLSYRKDHRMAKQNLPPEVGLLHRVMSGARMSLISLYLPDSDIGYEPVPGWADQPFSADAWTKATEESKLLVGSNSTPNKNAAAVEALPSQLCVAPASMISRVLHTVVDYPDKHTPAADFADYGTDAATILAYGKAYYRLEQARSAKLSNADRARNDIASTLKGNQVSLSDTQERIMYQALIANLRQRSQTDSAAITEAVRSAVHILGYNPTNFQPARPSF